MINEKKLERKLNFIRRNLIIGAIFLALSLILVMLICLLTDFKLTDPKFIASILGVIVILGIPSVIFIGSSVCELIEVIEDNIKADIIDSF